jgi:type IV secretory system conjugative DNA transfer VirD4/TraG family protein
MPLDQVNRHERLPFDARRDTFGSPQRSLRQRPYGYPILVEFGSNRMMALRRYSAALIDRRRRPNPEGHRARIGSAKPPGLSSEREYNRRSRHQSSRQQVTRRLIKPEDVMQRLHDDEQVVLIRNAAPLRCGRTIYFRRPEMLERVRLRKVQPLRSRTSR